MKRRGFTMIEILIVIGVLLVLVTIVIFASRGASSSAQLRATRSNFESLKGMVTELEVGGGGRRQPPHQWIVDENVTPPTWTAAGVDVWSDADPTEAGAQSMIVPLGLVKSDVTDRFRSPQMLNTQLIFRILYAVPAVKAAIQQLPADALANLPEMPDTDPWAPPAGWDETQPPIVLDGWNNPIIFVPSAGLNRVLPHDATAAYMPGTYVTPDAGTTVYRSLQPIAGQALSDAEYWQTVTAPPVVRSPDRRPFFASAGPDGSFAASDDNLYSFEN